MTSMHPKRSRMRLSFAAPENFKGKLRESSWLKPRRRDELRAGLETQFWVEQATGLLRRATNPLRFSAASCRRGRAGSPFHPILKPAQRGRQKNSPTSWIRTGRWRPISASGTSSPKAAKFIPGAGRRKLKTAWKSSIPRRSATSFSGRISPRCRFPNSRSGRPVLKLCRRKI